VSGRRRNSAADPAETGPTGMQHPERWLAFVRIVVGAWFLKSVLTKLTAGLAFGFLPILEPTARWLDFMPTKVSEYTAGGAGWYAAFLRQVVLPNAHTFATLTAFGEAVVGVGLTLGLFARPAAVVGLFLSLNYLMATGWMTPGQMGFHIVLVASMVAFIGADAGRAWGLDAWLPQTLARMSPKAVET
jgi:uncharacterized membrane protein YphA (DoxX/SURF4 family)